jgi:ATP-dependent Clp protease ATP-binding subunit ClpB
VLDLDDAAKLWLAEEGYDPVFGARPLKRVLQRALQDPLAGMLLAGDLLEGDRIAVSASPDGLVIGDRVAAPNRPAPQDATLH